jgi:hypothetical protein
VAYLANTSAEDALGLRSTSPTALLNLAENTLSQDESFKVLDGVLTTPRYARSFETSPAVYAQMRSWAESALLQQPLNARAFRILGQISERTSTYENTEALMRAAVRRSLMQSVAVYWMMRKSYQDRDYRATLRYADTLLRTRPQMLEYIMPLFGAFAEDRDASGELKRLLATNPPWRPRFFLFFPKTVSDAPAGLDILLSLKDTPNPATAEDLRAYLDFLIQHGFYDLAYYAWLQFLPTQELAGAGHLFNGRFESIPSGVPFDWIFAKGTGVTVQIATPRDLPGERALSLEFGPGRVKYRDVTQLIVLSPGTYKFRGKYKADLVSERGLEWRITCAGDQALLIGRSPTVKGTTQTWTEFEFSFTVPQPNCPAQYVRLVFDARSTSERFISGSIWYDDLQIVRESIDDASVIDGLHPQGSEQASQRLDAR